MSWLLVSWRRKEQCEYIIDFTISVVKTFVCLVNTCAGWIELKNVKMMKIIKEFIMGVSNELQPRRSKGSEGGDKSVVRGTTKPQGCRVNSNDWIHSIILICGSFQACVPPSCSAVLIDCFKSPRHNDPRSRSDDACGDFWNSLTSWIMHVNIGTWCWHLVTYHFLALWFCLVVNFSKDDKSCYEWLNVIEDFHSEI